MALSSPSPSLNTSEVRVLRRPVESTLDSMIGMNDPAGRRCARPNSHIKGVDDEG